jgi:hypothetical protein
MATAKQQSKVMHEHKHGTLKSGSGRKVESRKQAIAIASPDSPGPARRPVDREGSMANEYKPGEIVPQSGIYKIIRDRDHPDMPHEVTAVKGRRFPTCRHCKGELRARPCGTARRGNRGIASCSSNLELNGEVYESAN